MNRSMDTRNEHVPQPDDWDAAGGDRSAPRPNTPSPGALSNKLSLEQSSEISAVSSSSRRMDERGYMHIKDGRKFFKVGRVFMVLWTEPVGKSSKFLADQQTSFLTQLPAYGETVYTKVRRFAVFSEQKGCCVCIRLSTYGGRGTLKPGLNVANHAAVYAEGGKPMTQPGERLGIDPFPIIIENKDVEIDPMSRLNFGNVQTIQHNVKVKKIGRIPKEHHKRLVYHVVGSMTGSDFMSMATADTDHGSTWRPLGLPPSRKSSDSGYKSYRDVDYTPSHGDYSTNLNSYYPDSTPSQVPADHSYQTQVLEYDRKYTNHQTPDQLSYHSPSAVVTQESHLPVPSSGTSHMYRELSYQSPSMQTPSYQIPSYQQAHHNYTHFGIPPQQDMAQDDMDDSESYQPPTHESPYHSSAPDSIPRSQDLVQLDISKSQIYQ